MVSSIPTDERPPAESQDTGPGNGRRRLLLGAGAAALAVVLLVVAGVALLGGGDDAGDAGTAAPPASAGASAGAAGAAVPLGVFQQTSAEEVAGFEAWLGRDVDYVVDFSSRDTWAEIANPDYLLKEWQGTEHRLVYAVPMLPTGDDAPTMAEGAAGAYDRYFTELGQRLVATGHEDAILRVGWEFNLDSWAWATDDTDAFKGFFRRVVTAMRAVPGNSFEIDWNVNNGSGNAYDATGYWPGDEYVDYVGVDAYDQSGRFYPYPATCDESCREDRQTQAWERSVLGGDRGLRYWSDFARDHGKKLSLPEWGLWERPDGTGGGDDPAYVRRMHAFITDPANNVGYQAYFEHDGDDGAHSLADAFPRGGAEFKRLFGAR